MSRLFGTDGVRGIANGDLSPELAFRLGEAAGDFLGERGHNRVVVGRDTRISGCMLQSALVSGILSTGAETLVAGVIPTPAVAFLTRELGADGGIVISASHNPPEYNGIKFFSSEGFKLPDELEDEIARFVASEERPERPTAGGVGRMIELEDAVERYITHAVGTIPDGLSGLKVALDCGHGASSVSTPDALRRLGAEVVAVNCEWTGTDINVGSGSTHLDVIAELTVSSGADLGLAHDGDADRVLAVDETGQEVDGDMIMAMAAVSMKDAGRLSGDMVVATVMSNLGFEMAMREHGVHVVKTKVGDRYVLEQMLANGAVLGGEQSGHIIFLEHNTTGDGLVTALQLCELTRAAGRPLSEVKSVMRRYPQVLINVAVADKTHLSSSEPLRKAVQAVEKELGDEGRVLVRASGTEPMVRVMVEASEESAAASAAERLAGTVRAELG